MGFEGCKDSDESCDSKIETIDYKLFEIVGNANFIEKTKKALDGVFSISLFNQYSFLLNKGIKIIQDNTDARPETIIERGDGSIKIKIDSRTTSSNTKWFSSIIIHELNHIKLFFDNKPTNGERTPDFLWKGLNIEKSCREIQIQALGQLGGDNYYIKYLQDFKY